MSEHFDDLYGSKYLAASDVKKPFITTIEAVDKINFARDGERQKKEAVLTLKGVSKPAVVDKTNADTLSEAFGKEFDDWIDKRITVKAERTQFGGKPVMGLRVYPVELPKKGKLSDEMNDELPEDL
jgi:hypothetical protein